METKHGTPAEVDGGVESQVEAEFEGREEGKDRERDTCGTHKSQTG